MFSGSEYPKKYIFNFENRSTVGDYQLMSKVPKITLYSQPISPVL